jgi:TPR repeat protein
MYNAGFNYENGGNNLRNKEKAYQWFEKGHTKNHFGCSVKFANYCHDGTECEVDKQKAEGIYNNISNKMIQNQQRYLKKPVREACYNYGMILFMKGDIINGLRYIDCAQKNGCEKSKKKLERMLRAGREGEEENDEGSEEENEEVDEEGDEEENEEGDEEESEEVDEEDASEQEENDDY